MSRFLQLTLSFFLVIGLTSACSNNDPDGLGPCGANFNYFNEVEDELNTLSNALNAYATEQSAANCTAVKNAYQAYINALIEVDACVRPADRDAYRDALQEAQDNIDSIC